MLKDKESTRASRARLANRARRRGAAMVESIVVIPVFILFFVGMMYFRKLYQNQLYVMRLARTAAVSYGMNGCNGSPTAAIDEEIAAGGISLGSLETIAGFDPHRLDERLGSEDGAEVG